MKLIVGLGNPGKEYENNRHNVGFLTASAIKKKFETLNPKFETNSKFKILKPKTYMNNSGVQVKKEADYYKIDSKDIFVIHDDLDLEFGTLRVSFDSSSAGHNGVQSIIDELKTNHFWRIRIGIGRPSKNIPSEKFVLQDFNNEEQKQLPKIIDYISEKMLKLISDPKEETIKI